VTPSEQSTFDPDAFLSGGVDAGFSTEPLICPEGSFRAQIDNYEGRSIQTDNGERKILRIMWDILDDGVRTQLERTTVKVPQDIWLDLDSNGALDTGKGKNVDLGRLREALGQNATPGWTFSNLRGQMALVRVAHRSDRNNPERKFAEIRRVTAAV
jgi:hypothetical protein